MFSAACSASRGCSPCVGGPGASGPACQGKGKMTRLATVLSKQTLVQQGLAQALEFDQVTADSGR